jgi:hypothetical protein
MIAGTDLAAETLEPHEFFSFLGGNMKSMFVKSGDELRYQLAQLDEKPDPDGRFRINDFFCFDNVWKEALRSLVFLLASKGRQNRPADAASPKKKNPSVAPAKLALYELGLASQVQGYAPFFFTLGLMWLEQLRPRTLQDLSFFLRNGSPAKAGIKQEAGHLSLKKLVSFSPLLGIVPVKPSKSSP